MRQILNTEAQRHGDFFVFTFGIFLLLSREAEDKLAFVIGFSNGKFKFIDSVPYKFSILHFQFAI